MLTMVMALATLLASLGFAAPARGAEPLRVAIIVGPVGEELTPVYLALAEAAAAAAEARGAEVARAYSPDATAARVDQLVLRFRTRALTSAVVRV